MKVKKLLAKAESMLNSEKRKRKAQKGLGFNAAAYRRLKLRKPTLAN